MLIRAARPLWPAFGRTRLPSCSAHGSAPRAPAQGAAKVRRRRGGKGGRQKNPIEKLGAAVRRGNTVRMRQLATEIRWRDQKLRAEMRDGKRQHPRQLGEQQASFVEEGNAPQNGAPDPPRKTDGLVSERRDHELLIKALARCEPVLWGQARAVTLALRLQTSSPRCQPTDDSTRPPTPPHCPTAV